jgi:hypothetical protein
MFPALRLPIAGFTLLLASVPQTYAQSPAGTLRPGVDSSVATGIGTGSSFKNVPPPANQPPIDTSRKFMWDTPESTEAFRKDKVEDGSPPRGASPPQPPAAEVKEDPRTMITRDRIESPQH